MCSRGWGSFSPRRFDKDDKGDDQNQRRHHRDHADDFERVAAFNAIQHLRDRIAGKLKYDAFIETSTGMGIEAEWLDVEEAPVIILDNRNET